MSVEFTLPELGENIEKGDVVRVLVSAGDVLKIDQAILELETDKATIEVPSTVTGKVTDIKVKAGDKVKVGQVVLVVEGDAAGTPAVPTGKTDTTDKTNTSDKSDKPETIGKAENPDKKQKLATAAATPEAEEDVAPSPRPEPPRPATKPAPVVDISSGRAAQVPKGDSPAGVRAEPAAAAHGPGRVEGTGLELAPSVPAAPSVRRFARELGIDIGRVSGTGPGGRIGQDDVKQHVKSVVAGPSAAVAGYGVQLPDFSKWGDIEVKPMSNIRRKTAEHLSIAWQAPHVTQHDKADVTAVEEFRQAYGPRVEKAGGKLTVTAILIKIAATALKRYPQFASSPDMANDAIVYKKYCHIGVAVDTPNGLLVPVIRDADTKGITQISVELAALSQKARDKKLSLDEMAGSVFSISNLGGIGGTAFTPIINQPEVAILGVSRSAKEPVWRDPSTSLGTGGQFVPREMLPLSLSYDHRVIDGADAARFLRFIAEALEQPLTLYL
jgi:pyruvate dehydrogenase E2 component (dihydrolipoamide acetyltransferase)